MDRHVAPVAHKVPPAQVDRLIADAVARHMPDEAEARRREAWDQTPRHHPPRQPSASPAPIDHRRDRPGRRPRPRRRHPRRRPTIGDLGTTETLDHAAPPPSATSPAATSPSTTRPTSRPTSDRHPTAAQSRPTSATAARKVVLHVHLHLSEAAVRGSTGRRGGCRSGGWRTPGPGHRRHHPRLVRPPRRHVIVKPVIDLADHVSVDGLRGPRPDRRTRRAARRHLRLPLVHPTRPQLDPTNTPATTTTPSPTPRADPPAPARSHPCAADTTGSRPTAAGLRRPRTRHLPVDQPPRLPVPPRPHRHPRRISRPLPPRRPATGET